MLWKFFSVNFLTELLCTSFFYETPVLFSFFKDV